MIRVRYERVEQHGFIEFLLESPIGNATAKLCAIKCADGYQEFELLAPQSDQKSIFFNSYYLDDGDFELKLSLFNDEGEICAEHIGRYQICNGSSKLSSDLREAFRANSSYALTGAPLDSAYFKHLPAYLNCQNYPIQSRPGSAGTFRVLSDQQVADFDRNGTLILSSFFDQPTINDAKKVLSEVNENQLFGFQKGSSQRIVNLHESYEELNRLYSSSKLYDAVSDLFGVQALPCQSLTFINGSTQDAHQDTVHLTPFPRGLMCGIWIAIEDVVAGAGELFFYPGSHTFPAVLCSTHYVPKVNSEDGDYSKFASVFTPQINELLASNQSLESRQFLAKAGDVLIWQENLIHGGSPRTIQDKTRMSMVIHAFGQPALIYYDSLGMSGKRDTSLR
jgi:hypothetical protein